MVKYRVAMVWQSDTKAPSQQEGAQGQTTRPDELKILAIRPEHQHNGSEGRRLGNACRMTLNRRTGVVGLNRC